MSCKAKCSNLLLSKLIEVLHPKRQAKLQKIIVHCEKIDIESSGLNVATYSVSNSASSGVESVEVIRDEEWRDYWTEKLRKCVRSEVDLEVYCGGEWRRSDDSEDEEDDGSDGPFEEENEYTMARSKARWQALNDAQRLRSEAALMRNTLANMKIALLETTPDATQQPALNPETKATEEPTLKSSTPNLLTRLIETSLRICVAAALFAFVLAILLSCFASRFRFQEPFVVRPV
eukprot:CAMPEP_0182443086 /NCGR_PEP_ID=MMETSP1172-20130603/1918_1 /TAXON_ID=708627 /ORGANISM="Timspurckia oligopyrenoides, Strain CCMP3278" /LENGTH=232 /DNA_ID=CAMNT_0024638253 /DNA_START=403 /DNA_END=1101 /DNA_ORIENTATION=+